MSDLQLVKKDNQVWVSSRVVAEKFEKLHKNVIRDIENLECSKEFSRLKIEPANYLDKQGTKAIHQLKLFAGREV